MNLDIRHVSHSFDGVRVLDDVVAHVGSGQLAAVLGQSGCGKTTLLRIVAGLLRPDAGTVTLNGRDLSAVAPQHRHISLVPQEGALFPHLTVAGNVGFGLRGGAAHPRTRDLLDLVGLTDLANRMPHEISGGQAQRVAVARALAVEPELVLLDEPFSALDASARGGLRADMRQLLKDTGTTAILVTHDQEEALSLADELVLMADGRVVQSGPPAQVYRRPASVTAARLCGHALCLPAMAQASRAETALGMVATHEPAAGPGVVVLRPEQLRLEPHPSSDSVVTNVTFYGHDADITVRHSDGVEVVVRQQAPSWRAGQPVTVHVEGAASFYAD